jgi:hypothetical protein
MEGWEWAPYVTSAVALFQVGTVRRWPVVGFAAGLAVQPVWVAFTISTEQWGFLIATVGFIALNGWNLFKSVAARIPNNWCAHCGKRERFWQVHYLHGALPGYVCEPALTVCTLPWDHTEPCKKEPVLG